MKSSSFSVRRVVVLSLIFSCMGIVGLHTLHRTPWYKHRLYLQLLEGSPEQRLAAATALTRVNGRECLLEGLKSDQPDVRELSRRGLEHLWFTDAGSKAYHLVVQAYDAAQREEYSQALDVLNRLVAAFPQFAEGWNRRASVYWQIGEYEKSMADCRRALALNPQHYGAWQGIGICYLNMGDLEEACRCLRAALKIIPHDQSTRQSLRECEELIRTYQPQDSDSRSELLL